MLSSSYKSNLLRFAISQYRLGVERHRRVLGRARSRVKLSAELGTALVVLPVYAAVRASVSAGEKLKAAMTRNVFPTLSAEALKLLNFSGYEGISDEPLCDPVLDEKTVRAVPVLARSMFQLLTAAGSCLSRSQLENLSSLSTLAKVEGKAVGYTKFQRFRSRLMRWVENGRTTARRLLNFEVEALAPRCLIAAKPKKITGVASDVETRSLVLVLNYKTAWHGLSAFQQQRLRFKIANSTKGSSLVVKKRLLLSKVASWLSLGSAVTRWLGWNHDDSDDPPISLPDSSRPVELQLPQTPSAPTRVRLESGCFVIQPDETRSRFALPLASSRTGLASANDSKQAIACLHRAQTFDNETLEADVLATAYVEHPLEVVLKWVDRWLLGIEKWWQQLRLRLISQLEAMFY